VCVGGGARDLVSTRQPFHAQPLSWRRPIPLRKHPPRKHGQQIQRQSMVVDGAVRWPGDRRTLRRATSMPSSRCLSRLSARTWQHTVPLLHSSATSDTPTSVLPWAYVTLASCRVRFAVLSSRMRRVPGPGTRGYSTLLWELTGTRPSRGAPPSPTTKRALGRASFHRVTMAMRALAASTALPPQATTTATANALAMAVILGWSPCLRFSDLWGRLVFPFLAPGGDSRITRKLEFGTGKAGGRVGGGGGKTTTRERQGVSTPQVRLQGEGGRVGVRARQGADGARSGGGVKRGDGGLRPCLTPATAPPPRQRYGPGQGPPCGPCGTW
jgi:hypothetical protein